MDRVDAATRSRIMRAIKSKDTKPETRLAEALSWAGVEFVRNVKDLPGSPDFVFGRLAVFVHGCYWHSCPRHYREPKTRAEAWRAHMARNRRRDERVRRQLRRLGFATMVVWEHEAPDEAARRIARRLWARGRR